MDKKDFDLEDKVEIISLELKIEKKKIEYLSKLLKDSVGYKTWRDMMNEMDTVMPYWEVLIKEEENI